MKTAVASKLTHVHANLRLLRSATGYKRYQAIYENGALQMAASSALREALELGDGGWDGNCSDHLLRPHRLNLRHGPM